MKTLRQMFSDVQKELELAMLPTAWMMFVRPLIPVSYEAKVLTIEVPNEFVQHVCEVRIDQIIRRELQAHSGQPIETRYQVRKETETNGNGKGDRVLPVRRVDDPVRDQLARTEKGDGHVAGVSHWRGPRSGHAAAGVHGADPQRPADGSPANAGGAW